ncbi:MAG TPA: hypothetical protein VNO17_11720 [Actinomycetota bacterium]|nr:hypothetical protein [Actinomycetota bacterium]
MRPRSLRPLAALVGLGLVLGIGGGTTHAAFSSLTSNAGNSFSAAADFVAPRASGSVIATEGRSLAGAIRQGGTFRVYANVTDDGNPASGVASVTADASAIRAGATAVPLAAGSWSVEGVAYAYRSALLTADAVLPEGSRGYSLALTDGAGNAAVQGGFSVLVDNTPPAGADVQTANGGTTPGRAEAGDSVTFTFTERVDPGSVLAGWTGSATTVRVRIVDNGGNDLLEVRTASGAAALPLGSVALNGNHVTADRDFAGSTMTQAGGTITVTLGTPSGATNAVNAARTISWTPSAGATDAAGNPCTTTAVSEGGPSDREF